jgi:membrane protease YdiL (CAAX protease family)
MSLTRLDPNSLASPDNPDALAPVETPAWWTRFWQLRHLAIVLLVTLSGPIVGSSYVLLGGRVTDPIQQSYRLVGALRGEATSLLLLWYVLGRQGKTWKDIGWKVGIADVPRGVGLFIASLIASVFASVPFQDIYRAYSGHFLAPKSLHSLLGFGISFLSIAFVCLNPFFEELIVRGYAMSEIMSSGGTAWMAIVVSVALQMSYHLYQGLAHAIGLTVVFTVFSIYYAQTRRIVPVVLAHLLMDVIALVGGVS